jgi:hypothetical protein
VASFGSAPVVGMFTYPSVGLLMDTSVR